VALPSAAGALALPSPMDSLQSPLPWLYFAVGLARSASVSAWARALGGLSLLESAYLAGGACASRSASAWASALPSGGAYW